MNDYTELRISDLMDPGVFYKAYKDYAFAHKYIQEHQKEFKVSETQMRSRIQYILKNKINQRDEISTLCWILGEEDERKTKY